MAKEKELNRIIVTVKGGCIQTVFTKEDIDLEIIDWDEDDEEINPYHSYDLEQWEDYIKGLREIY